MKPGHSILDRIGYRLNGFRDYTFRDAVGIIARTGFRAVELCLEHPDLDNDNPGRLNAGDILNILYDNDLTASSVSYHTKTAGWDIKLNKSRYGTRLASETGCGIFVGAAPANEYEDGFQRMVEFTRELCAEAEKREVIYALEPEPGTIIGNSGDMRRLMSLAVSPWLKVNLDIGHVFITEPDVAKDIEGWRDLIVHTHIEDIEGKIHRHLIPGAGDIDFQKVFHAFYAIEYQGYYILDIAGNKNDPVITAVNAFKAIEKIARRYDI